MTVFPYKQAEILREWITFTLELTTIMLLSGALVVSKGLSPKPPGDLLTILMPAVAVFLCPLNEQLNTVISTVACAISQGISLTLKIWAQPLLKLLMLFCIKKKFYSWKSKNVTRARNSDTVGVTQPFVCLKVSDYWGKASLLSHSTHWVSTLASCSR